MESGGCVGLGTGSADLLVSTVSMDFSTTNPKCFNTEDGVINTTISGTDLLYEWNNGSTEKNLRGVAAGTYILSVSDNKNCVYQDSAILITPPAIRASIVDEGRVNCYTPKGVSLQVIAEGGTPGYLYNW